MLVELGVGLGLMGLQWVYHRLTDEDPTKKKKAREIEIPRVDTGATVPAIYGRARVRAPILAWRSRARSAKGSIANGSPDAARIWLMDTFYVIGIPFDRGRGTNNVHGMWAGDARLSFIPPFAEVPLSLDEDDLPVQVFQGGQVEIFDGDPAQTLDSSNIGARMLADSVPPVTINDIPGYRGYVSIGLYGSGAFWWSLGTSPTVPAYSFEASSYHTNHAQLGTFSRVGSDSNPVNAIFDLLTSPQHLGLPESVIDMTTFQACQYTLHTETHGYSRAIESAAEAGEHIAEILRQIDGVLRHNPVTNKLELKLVRNDYNPATIPHITSSNCETLMSFSFGGWSVVNSLNVVFTDRSRDYQDNTVTAENQANAGSLGQNAKSTQVLQYPGITSEALAKVVADRELAARSRPLMKFRAVCDRSMLRVAIGDAVKVTWTNPDIAGVVFRVGNVEHGTLEDGKIALDLIQDHYYVYRGSVPVPPVGPEVIDIPPVVSAG